MGGTPSASIDKTPAHRGLAQSGSARDLGSRGPRFESLIPDHFLVCDAQACGRNATSNRSLSASRCSVKAGDTKREPLGETQAAFALNPHVNTLSRRVVLEYNAGMEEQIIKAIIIIAAYVAGGLYMFFAHREYKRIEQADVERRRQAKSR